jgi:hypothetical protein
MRPRHHDFPWFSGETPLLWIDLCHTYFEMYKVLAHYWISTATLALGGSCRTMVSSSQAEDSFDFMGYLYASSST